MSAKGLDTQGLDKILERGLALTHQYVNKKMGAANGIAPLDAYGRVPLSHLPASQQGEMFVYFDRMETSITAIQAGSSESSESEGYKVAYSTSQNQFFLVDYSGIHTGTLQGYPLWLESDMAKYGTVGSGSVIPYTGKVYICRKDNSTWVWDGSKLASFDFGSEAVAGLSARIEEVNESLTGKIESDRGQFGKAKGYIESNVAGTANYVNTGIIPLNRDADIVYYTDCGIGLAAVAFFDKDLRYLPESPRGQNGLAVRTVAKADFPAEARYFALTNKSATAAQAWWKNGESLEGRLDAISRAILESSGAVPEFPVKDKYINASTGVLGNTAGYQTTGLIAIDRTADIAMTGRGTTSVAGIALYDAAGAFISAKPFTSSNTQMTLTVPAAEIPAAAAYFAASCNGAYYSTWSNGRASLAPLANAAKAAEKAVLIKRWNAVFGTNGKYNLQTNYFEAFDELTDITDEQALLILEEGVFRPPHYHQISRHNQVRCTIPIPSDGFGAVQAQNLSYCCFSPYIEVLCFCRKPNKGVTLANGIRYFFQDCSKLKKVIGIIDISLLTNGSDEILTGGYPLLEEIEIKGFKKTGITFAKCPKLNLASLQYLVDNSAVPAGSNATVTLHADVYAKLTDALIASAAEKRITFTSEQTSGGSGA